MNKKETIYMGAAVAAGLVGIGTLTSIYSFRKPKDGWLNQAKTANVNIAGKKEKPIKKWMLGSIAGGILGIATALLFAPKSGNKLVKDLFEPSRQKRASPAAKSKAKKNRSSADRFHTVEPRLVLTQYEPAKNEEQPKKRLGSVQRKNSKKSNNTLSQ